MLRCWQDSPSQRPTFTELVKEFDAMLMSLSDKVRTRLSLPIFTFELSFNSYILICFMRFSRSCSVEETVSRWVLWVFTAFTECSWLCKFISNDKQ